MNISLLGSSVYMCDTQTLQGIYRHYMPWHPNLLRSNGTEAVRRLFLSDLARSSIVKSASKSTYHIDLLLTPIGYLRFAIIVDHCCGELGIKECNAEVNSEKKASITSQCPSDLECKLNVHKRCTRNVANDCGLDKKRLASVLAGLNINTEPHKIVIESSCIVDDQRASLLLFRPFCPMKAKVLVFQWHSPRKLFLFSTCH